MKRINPVLYLLLFALLTVSSCKKDNNNNNNSQPNPLSQALGGSPTIPAGAAGALYSVNNHVIADDGYGTLETTDVGTAYAWFDSYTSTKDAGTVSVNTVEIEHSFSGQALPWYYSLMDFPDFSSTNTASWTVAGNSLAGVTGFTHTDNTAFPKCSFTVPSSVNLNNSLTVNFTNTTSNDAVFVTIYAQGSLKVTKSLAANATSASFTSAELKSITSSGGQLGIQVMPVKLTSATINGKTYYFVKQWAFAQFTSAL
jgi:hypothetical protein